MALSVSFALNSGHVPMTLLVAGIYSSVVSSVATETVGNFITGDLKCFARLCPDPFTVDLAFSNEQRLVF